MNMKRDSVSAYVHIRRESSLFLYAAVRIFYECPHPSPHQWRTYLTGGLFLNQKESTKI